MKIGVSLFLLSLGLAAPAQAQLPPGAGELPPIEAQKLRPNLFLVTGAHAVGMAADRLELYYFGPTTNRSSIFIVIPALRAMLTGVAFADESLAIHRLHSGPDAGTRQPSR